MTRLLAEGADVDERDFSKWTALQWAARGAGPSFSPFHLSPYEGAFWQQKQQPRYASLVLTDYSQHMLGLRYISVNFGAGTNPRGRLVSCSAPENVSVARRHFLARKSIGGAFWQQKNC